MGFTLIELLVVTAIIGTLAGGILTFMNPGVQIKRANDARRKSDLGQIQKALEVYYSDNNAYPPNATFSFGSPWATYMGLVPRDPQAGRLYVYSRVDLNTYRMYASLERPTDTPSCGGVCPNAGGLSCGSGVCNYGATSTNYSP